METRLYWTKWNWDSWLSEETLRLSSLEGRGAWTDMLSLMGKSSEYGVLLINGEPPSNAQMARIFGVSAEKTGEVILELLVNGVGSKRALDGAIFCRRMVREQKARDAVRRRVRKHRKKGSTEENVKPSGNATEPDELPLGNGGVTPVSQTEERGKRKEVRGKIPHTPNGGLEAREKHRMLDPTGIRIAGWFGRKASTRWTPKETKALTVLLPLEQSELGLVEAYYLAELPKKTDWRRRDLVTLLNNWPGEADRARDWRKSSGDDSRAQWQM